MVNENEYRVYDENREILRKEFLDYAIGYVMDAGAFGGWGNEAPEHFLQRDRRNVPGQTNIIMLDDDSWIDSAVNGFGRKSQLPFILQIRNGSDDYNYDQEKTLSQWVRKNIPNIGPILEGAYNYAVQEIAEQKRNPDSSYWDIREKINDEYVPRYKQQFKVSKWKIASKKYSEEEHTKENAKQHGEWAAIYNAPINDFLDVRRGEFSQRNNYSVLLDDLYVAANWNYLLEEFNDRTTEFVSDYFFDDETNWIIHEEDFIDDFWEGFWEENSRQLENTKQDLIRDIEKELGEELKHSFYPAVIEEVKNQEYMRNLVEEIKNGEEEPEVLFNDASYWEEILSYSSRIDPKSGFPNFLEILRNAASNFVDKYQSFSGFYPMPAYPEDIDRRLNDNQLNFADEIALRFSSKWKKISADEDEEYVEQEPAIRDWSEIEWDISSGFKNIYRKDIPGDFMSSYTWPQEVWNAILPDDVYANEENFLNLIEKIEGTTPEKFAEEWFNDHYEEIFDFMYESIREYFDYSIFSDEEYEHFQRPIEDAVTEQAFEYAGELTSEVSNLLDREFDSALDDVEEYLFNEYKDYLSRRDRRIDPNQEMMDVFDVKGELPYIPPEQPSPWLVELMRQQSKTKTSSNGDWSEETEILVDHILRDDRILNPAIKTMEKIVRKGGTPQELTNWIIENILNPYNEHIAQQWQNVSDEEDIEYQKRELRRAWKQQARKQFPFSLQKQKQYVQEMEQMQFGLLGDPEPENIEHYLLRVENIDWQGIYDWVKEDLQYRGKMASSEDKNALEEYYDEIYKKLYRNGIAYGAQAVNRMILRQTKRSPYEYIQYPENKHNLPVADRFYNENQLSLFREMLEIDDQIREIAQKSSIDSFPIFKEEYIEQVDKYWPEEKRNEIINKGAEYFLKGYEAAIRGKYKHALDFARKNYKNPEIWRESKWKIVSVDQPDSSELNWQKRALWEILKKELKIQVFTDAFHAAKRKLIALDIDNNWRTTDPRLVNPAPSPSNDRNIQPNQISVLNELIRTPPELKDDYLAYNIRKMLDRNNLYESTNDEDWGELVEIARNAWQAGWMYSLHSDFLDFNERFHEDQDFVENEYNKYIQKSSNIEERQYRTDWSGESLETFKELINQLPQEIIDVAKDRAKGRFDRDMKISLTPGGDVDFLLDEEDDISIGYSDLTNNRNINPDQLPLAFENLKNKNKINLMNDVNNSLHIKNFKNYIVRRTVEEKIAMWWRNAAESDMAAEEITNALTEDEIKELFRIFVKTYEEEWDRLFKEKTSSHGQNQMAIGDEVAETTFEGVEVDPDPEPEEKIINGKKWKMVRPKPNKQPAEYARPKGGWGFYSKHKKSDLDDWTDRTKLYIEEIINDLPNRLKIAAVGNADNTVRNWIQRSLKEGLPYYGLRYDVHKKRWLDDDGQETKLTPYEEKMIPFHNTEKSRLIHKNQTNLGLEQVKSMANVAIQKHDIFSQNLDWELGQLILDYFPEMGRIELKNIEKDIYSIIDERELESIYNDAYYEAWEKAFNEEVSDLTIKKSKKDAWEAVLDGELGHDILTTGTWEEVKKQTIKWLKQLKNGYINKKNPHDNKKIDPEAKEQDAHALEDLKLYEEKKRWTFHFDHGKHPYDLIIQPVGYKESKWKNASETKTKMLERIKHLPEDQSEIVHTFPSGWTIRKLKNYGDMNREGCLMGNCLALHDEGIYRGWYDHPYEDEDPEFWNERYKEDIDESLMGPFFSLRDESNFPHATYDSGWRYNPNYDPDEPSNPLLGRHNSDLKTEYKKYWKEFFNKRGISHPWDMWNKESKWKIVSEDMRDWEIDYAVSRIESRLPSFMYGAGRNAGWYSLQEAMQKLNPSLNDRTLNKAIMNEDPSRFYNPDQLTIFHEYINSIEIQNKFWKTLENYIRDELREIENDYPEENWSDVVDSIIDQLDIKRYQQEYYNGFDLAFTNGPEGFYDPKRERKNSSKNLFAKDKDRRLLQVGNYES